MILERSETPCRRGDAATWLRRRTREGRGPQRSCSAHRKTALANNARELGDLCFEIIAELLRRTADDVCAHGRNLLPNAGRIENRRQLTVELFDDGSRRSGRRAHRGP